MIYLFGFSDMASCKYYEHLPQSVYMPEKLEVHFQGTHNAWKTDQN
jgi:hypothetical protein